MPLKFSLESGRVSITISRHPERKASGTSASVFWEQGALQFFFFFFEVRLKKKMEVKASREVQFQNNLRLPELITFGELQSI